MKKRIIIELETSDDSDNENIKRHLKLWLIDNFQKSETAIITVEDGELCHLCGDCYVLGGMCENKCGRCK
jgi:hypothetical protein